MELLVLISFFGLQGGRTLEADPVSFPVVTFFSSVPPVLLSHQLPKLSLRRFLMRLIEKMWSRNSSSIFTSG